MERKRGGLVPIGEAFSGLDRPVKTIRESAHQALHHFTQADQVDELVGASEADPDLGFMARLMALCSLPRTNPGNRKEYVRRNGPYALVMTAGGLNKLPFGNLPACCWPGCAPKRCGPKAASWAWAVRSPSSCGRWGSTATAAALAGSKPGSATRWTGSLAPQSR